MIQLSNQNWRNTVVLAVAMAAMVACSDNDDNNPPPAAPAVTFEYDVTVVNLTAAQPFSPVAIVAHEQSYQLFTVGEAATMGLENLAEGGSNSELLAEAQNDAAVMTTVGADSPLAPGASASFSFSVDESDAVNLKVSVVTMLVNSNDAITAARNIDVSSLAVDESITLSTISYDSGTEANSEAAGTMPGPADSGEGFNAARDDIADQVRGHPGIISMDDGLSSSVLTQLHRWDNPVARVRITRTQ